VRLERLSKLKTNFNYLMGTLAFSISAEPSTLLRAPRRMGIFYKTNDSVGESMSICSRNVASVRYHGHEINEPFQSNEHLLVVTEAGVSHNSECYVPSLVTFRFYLNNTVMTTQ
jgi:hypothetical protein